MEKLHLFEGYGIELEYMIVDAETLSVKPVADRLLEAEAGQIVSNVEFDDLAWSNELVLHVIELKCNGPSPLLNGLEKIFHHDIQKINRILERMNGRLMPTAAHPWMNPLTETRLWPHEYSPIYEAYNRIFGCQGHGWSNLQSMHINLPFYDDEEFARLHAAIRIILPIIPALAASSPILDARNTGFLDTRMEVYRHNSNKIPSLTDNVIPEPVYSHQDYLEKILYRLYRDITPYDPEGVLKHEFLNSRGAIARFDRQTIEIRVIDIQECPQADIAIAHLILMALKSLVSESCVNLIKQKECEVDPLANIFLLTIKDANHALINDSQYLSLFGMSKSVCTAGELWHHIFENVRKEESIDPAIEPVIKNLIHKGCLADRILKSLDGDFSHERLKDVYQRLCECLEMGKMF